MLAQNFKTAEDLKIRDWELSGLIKVLGMLERDELQHGDRNTIATDLGFNMSIEEDNNGCGTVRCIGGWVAHLSNKSPFEYVNSYIAERPRQGIAELYWGRCNSDVTTREAAHALRNYLTTGQPNWHETLRG